MLGWRWAVLRTCRKEDAGVGAEARARYQPRGRSACTNPRDWRARSSDRGLLSHEWDGVSTPQAGPVRERIRMRGSRPEPR